MEPFLRARWLDVASATWLVDPAVVRAHVPAEIEVDLREGMAAVSLVAFSFVDTRCFGVPVPFHQRFPEINLRVYVRAGTERGVVFIRELVPRRAVATVARLVFNEPYVTTAARCGTTVEVAASGPVRHVSHRFGQGRSNAFDVWAAPEPTIPAEGSIERWLTHHTVGFGSTRADRPQAYRVSHPVWLCHPIRRFALDVDLERLYGKPWARLATIDPWHVALAAGGEVAVDRATPLARHDRSPAHQEAEHRPAGRTIVLYDEDCGICGRIAGTITSFDRDAQLTVAPIGSAVGAQLLRDLPPARRYDSWHVVDPWGKRYSGGAAFAPLCRALPGLHVAGALSEAAPGLLDVAYRTVARHRHGLSRLVRADACTVDA